MSIPTKNSFLLYNDQRPVIDALSDEQAGKLIKAIYAYCETLETQSICDPVVNMAFIGIKTALDRSYKKYLEICERNRNNGAKGGRPNKNPDEPKKPSGFSGNPKNPDEPKKPDSDSENDSDSDPEVF